ncbi:universal stress protein [Conexibacter sp. JD483]|uniref:universal stress protein n=1 Tax=unclassified Conexibacter TaxID=2627773 RepID=UPI0027224299|nr:MULTISPECIES: universal stress protein [unclassified Conexibacter]MDO8188948.1 universal stress protein [Conexibacter sp. CPCC 205706]MDO8201737.1 universal stress protein [Conexibacter sp. CPCC 205762]MDR9371420.1 universal stress protein [Conexibacter sp. JD483]
MTTSQPRPATILAAVDADPSARDAAVLAEALCGAGHAAPSSGDGSSGDALAPGGSGGDALTPGGSGEDAPAPGGSGGSGGDAPELVLAAVVVKPRVPLPLHGSDEERVREQLDAALAEVRGACAPNARTLLLSDRSPAHALREQIAREPVSAVVVGSSHRARPGEAFAGRTVRQVLHGAPCAVALAARGIADAASPAGEGASGTAGAGFALRRIVAGVDGSAEAAAALAVASELARRTGARLELVAIADDGLGMRPRRGPLAELAELTEWDDAVAARREHAQSVAERAAATLSGALDADRGAADANAGASDANTGSADADAGAIATDVRVGDPAEELARAAAGADLLVLGSRQWGALDRVVIGSTAEELLRGAPCSLLLVPRPHAADAVSAADADATGD